MVAYTKQRAWKERTGFEKSEQRRQYKADWARRRRLQPQPSPRSTAARSAIPTVGDEVEVRMLIFGKNQPVRGRVVVGTTLSEACPWPYQSSQIDLVRISYDAPGTCTVAWEHQGAKGLTSFPISRVRKVK